MSRRRSKETPHVAARFVATAEAPSAAGTLHRSRPAFVLVAAAVVAAAVLGVFWPLLSAQALSYDDDLYLLNNRYVQNPSWSSLAFFFSELTETTTLTGYTHPIALTSLMLDCALGGTANDLTAFHRTNLALHVVTCLCLMGVCVLLFGRVWPAALAALLFGLHPLMVEPLAWLGQRKALLAGTFSAICLLCYVLSVRTSGRRRWALIGVSLAAYAAGLLSKPSAVPVVALIVLLDVWPLRRISRQALVEKLPYLALAIAGAALALVSHAATAEVRLTETGPGTKLLTLLHKVGFYAGKIIWPSSLSSFYPTPAPLAWSNADVLIVAAFGAALLGAAAVSLRWTKAAAVCTLMFLAALSPVLGGVGYSWIYAFDNYLYIPLFGAAIGAAWALQRVSRRSVDRNPTPIGSAANAHPPSAKSYVPYVGVAIAIALLAAEAVATRRYLSRWQDTDGLHAYMVSLNPDHARPHFVRAYYLAHEGDSAEAIEAYKAAAKLDPTLPGVQANLGQLLLDAGRAEEAIAPLAAAAEQMPDVPARHFALGLACAQTDRMALAAAAFENALALDPHHMAAMENLGRACFMLDRFADAAAAWQRRLAEGPAGADVHEMLGEALIRLDRPAEGVAQLVLALRAGRARVELALRVVWLLATHEQAAVRNGAEALSIAAGLNRATGGRDPRVLDALAAALAETGDFDEAARAAESAVAIARGRGDDATADAIEARLAAYREGRAWRDEEGSKGVRE